MEQQSLPFPAPAPVEDTRSAALQELAEKYCQRHRSLENYLLAYYFLFRLLGRLRLQGGTGPLGLLGQLCTILLMTAATVGPALAVTALLDEWSIAPVGTWIGVGFCTGLLIVLMYRPLVRAIDNFLCLHRAIADEEGLGGLIAWEHRWFRRRVATPIALLFATGLLLYLYFLEVHYGERPMAWGTALVGFMLLYGVGEIIYSVLLLALESYVLRECDYQMYRLSPLDTVAMRRAVRGSSQIGLLVSLVVTMFIVGFVVLLEDRPMMVTQVGLFLLALSYMATLAGVLLPRLAIKALVQRQKERTLTTLQQRIDGLAAHLDTLSDEQYAKFKRLKEAHDVTRDASEEVLPMRALGRLIGALVLPTMTFVASRFGESILQGMLHQIRR